ncbi:MAG: hypothetical protein BYD32DRAFT_486317 [Podila humilis]|nr:MAG: hypothetical protein BYD32DRAFT_486317 [Podila humilis]
MNQEQYDYLIATSGDSISLMAWAQHGDVNLAVEMDAQWRYDALRTLARSDLVDHQRAYVRLNKLDTQTRMAVFEEVEEGAWLARNAQIGDKRPRKTTPPVNLVKRTRSNTLNSSTEPSNSTPSSTPSISSSFAEMLDKFQDAASSPSPSWVLNGTLYLDDRLASLAMSAINEIFLHSFILDIDCHGTMDRFTEAEQEAIRSAKRRLSSSCKESIIDYMLIFNEVTLDDLWTRLETNDARDKSAPVEDVPVRDWIYNAVYQFARLVEGKTNNGFGGLWTPHSKEWYKLNLWKFPIDDLFLNCTSVSLCYKASVARAYRKYMANPKEDMTRDDRIDGVFVAGSYSKEVGAVHIGPEVGKEEGSDVEILAEELRQGKLLKDQHDYITRLTPAKSEFVAHGIQLNGPCIQFLVLDHVAGSFLRLKRSPVYTVPDEKSL